MLLQSNLFKVYYPNQTSIFLSINFKTIEKMKSIKQFLIPMLMVILVSLGFSPHLMGQGSATYSSPGNGTWTPPPGVASFTLKLWGAGGGGGNTLGTDGQGGGGGGAFQIVNVTNASYIGIPINLSVGAGGTAGNSGANTTWGNVISAAGGSGSNSGNGFGGLGGVGVAQSFSDATFSAAWSGGNGGASTNPQQTSFGGGGGGRADNGNNGGNGTNGGTSGSGAPGVGGLIGGGAGGNTGGVGGNATSYGGGGGGRGFNGANSGTGGNGRIEITWTCPTLTSITYPSPTFCNSSSASPTIVPSSSVGGTFTSATLGSSLNPATGVISAGAPAGVHTITYGWPAFGGCPAASVTTIVAIGQSPSITTFSYATPFCNNNNSTVSPTLVATGATGVFSFTGSGTLGSFSTANGSFNPSTSTPGSYIITYTIPVSNGCPSASASTSVTITSLPTIANFDYPPAGPNNNIYCAGAGLQSPSATVTNPNSNTITYSSLPAGLTIDASTGVVNPATSTPGVYTVTMTIAAGGGCSAVTATTSVTILARPTATIAYVGSPYCQTVGSTSQAISITGVTGGPLVNPNFSYVTAPGLTLDATTGAIDLNSTPGTYTVKYRFNGANGCLDSSSTTVTIRSRPSSTISYSGANPICSNVSPTVGGTVTSASNWTLTLSNGQTTTGSSGTNVPWSIAVNTLNPGQTATYSVTSLVSQFCSGVAIPDMPGSVTITKRTTTSGSIPTAANVKVCEGLDASINVTLTSPAQCAPTPQFSGVFKIEKWNGASWVFQNNYPWTITVGPSTTGIAAAINIPPSNFPNTTSNTINYRVSWVSLVDCNGCTADPLTGSVVIESVPTADLTISASPTGDVCPGANIVFSVNQTTTIPNAVFNWEATDAQGNVLGSGSNVTFGTNAVNTNLGLSCPFNGLVTFTFNSINPNCCNCIGAPIVRTVMVRDIVAPNLITAGTFPANQTLVNTCMGSATLPASPTLVPTAAQIAALYIDNCGGTVTVVRTGGRSQNSTNCAWSYTYSYSIKDPCGNEVTPIPTITISGGDKTAPSLTGVLPLGATNMNLCFSAIPVGPTAAEIAALYTDNCSGNTVTANKSGEPTGTNCAWSVTYTYVISDNCGNTTTTSITYSGGDKTAPTLTGVLPLGATNMNLCFSAIPVGPTAAAIAALYTDNCSGNTVTATKSGTPTGTNCAWSVTYIYVISDNCGNTTTTSITYSGGDRTAPTLTGVLPLGATNMNLCFSAIPVGPTAAEIAALYTDNCSGNTVSATKSGTPTGTNCAWSVTYTYVISDNCGNTTTTSITYSGADVSAPVISNVIPTQTLNTGAGVNCGVPMPNYTGLVVATDCGTFTLTQLAPNAPGTMVFGYNGFRDIVIEARDACGNVSTTTFRVLLKDLTAPTAICRPFTVDLNAAGNASIVVANVNNGSFDNCTPTSQLVYSLSQTNFNCSNVGTNNVILSVTDLCGNVSTCTAVVTVRDVTAPVITCFADTIINKNANCTYTLPDLTFRVNRTDACGIGTITQSIPVGTIFAASITSMPITLTVTDVNGNASTCTFLITFRDVTPPVISGCPSNITVFTGLGRTTCNQVATWIPPTATDACIHLATETQPIFGNFAPGATFPVGVTTVTYTATDVAGNVATCSFTVTVIDNTAPVIAGCPSNISVNTGAGRTTCDQTATWTEPTATDNCTAAGSLIRTRSHAPGSVFPVGTTTVTYTFADAAGNVSLPCSFNVVVTDNTAPIIACPANIANPPINTAGCLATVATSNPTISDNCGVTTLTWAITGAGITPNVTSPTTGINFLGTRTFNFGVTTVTYTVSDAAGNQSTCSFTVTVTRPFTSAISGTTTVQQNNTGTANVLFTSQLGTAPYTIVYTPPTGPNVTIVTNGTNSSTIGANPNWLVTTVPQSSAVPGTYVYRLVSVTDAFGCVVTPNTTATITVVGTNYPAPDLTPSITSLGNLIVQPTTTSLGYIDLYNVAPNPTTGVVSLQVYAPANFNLVIGSSTTAVGSDAVDNSSFDIVSVPGIGYLISSKPGVVVNADSGLKIGFQMTATGPNSTKGKLGVVLVNKTGGIITVVGDNNNSNNGAAETYSIIN